MKVRWALGLGVLLGLLGCVKPEWGEDHLGRQVDASALQGRWLVVNYWAEWCAPCRREVPELNRVQQEWAAQDVRVLGVNFDGLQGDALATAVQALGMEYPSLRQDPSARWKEPRAQGLPLTLVIDPQGQVRLRLAGEQTAHGLGAQLRALRP